MHGLFGDWGSQVSLEPGYTLALPMPMDMPFLLCLALEGLAAVDTPNCEQILIVPDGWGNDRGQALRDVMRDFDDPRLELVDLSWLDYRAIRMNGPLNFAHTHWMAVVNATRRAKHEFVFLHDADAFFRGSDGLELQYAEIKQRKLDVLGVTPRWDPFYHDRSITIPGTWELMYSVQWARRRSPIALMPGTWPTSYGEYGFDSMHYAMFQDRELGNLGIMSRPTSFVHFNGTICTYRSYRDRNGKSVTDELFRLLLLSLIETALDVQDDDRCTPLPDALCQGLEDSNYPVRYDSEVNRRGYGEFRTMIEQLNNSPAFVGDRAERIKSLLAPFDEHFEYNAGEQQAAAISAGDERRTGLGNDT
jgi:hypothetical protein